MIDIACLIVVGVVTWMVAGEGVWGAAQTFLCTLLAGLIAMNYFEPLAKQLSGFLPDNYCDIVALLGLFAGVCTALRMGAEQLSPSYVQVYPMLDTAGRWVVGAATGYLTMAIVLTALHTAPLPREFAGFKPERNNFFGSAPDRQWLGFTQYVSEKPLAILMSDMIGGKQILIAKAFDGRYEKVGDPLKPYSIKDLSGQESYQVIWPSFPIRYAMRRERFGGGISAAPAPVPYNPGAGGGVQKNANPGF